MIKALLLVLASGFITGFGLGYAACASDNGLQYNDWHLLCFTYLLKIVVLAIIIFLLMTWYDLRKK